MRLAWRIFAAGALAVAGAQGQADDPAAVQDPPGEVDVRQPAGVALPDRNTERDTTDTLRGGGRSEVIESGSPGAHAAEGRADVQPGEDARAAFGPGAEADAAPAEAGEPPDTAEATSLGTDTGHGTGTELEAPPPTRR